MRNLLQILFVFITLFSFSYLKGQDSVKTKKFIHPELIEVGAGLGLDAFGSSGLLFSIRPTIITPIHERIHLGITPNVTFYRDLTSNFDDIRAGGSIWGRGYFSQNFFGQAELEALSVRTTFDPNISQQRAWRGMAMIGAGYRNKIDIINTYVTTMYILNYNFKTPYPRKIVIRAGATVLLSELFKHDR